MYRSVVILAAGQGTRLRPLTTGLPKCMVPVKGRPLIEWQLEVIRRQNDLNVVVVRGYEKHKIDYQDVVYVENQHFATTNMVESLLCASSEMQNGAIISYGDIIYESKVLDAMLNEEADISVAVDRKWRPYWEQRFENVLGDAESLRVSDNGMIEDIGKKCDNVEEIEGQFVGLIGLRKNGYLALCDAYQDYWRHRDESIGPDSRSTFMTDILQHAIVLGNDVKPVWIDGGWLEIDSLKDHRIGEELIDGNPTDFTILR